MLTKPALSAGELRHFRFIRARLCLDQIRVVIVALDQLGGRTTFDNLSFVLDKDQVRVANIWRPGGPAGAAGTFSVKCTRRRDTNPTEAALRKMLPAGNWIVRTLSDVFFESIALD